MTIRLLASIVCACWWVAEFTRSRLRDKKPLRDSDRGTSRLWDASHLLAVIGIVVGFTPLGQVRTGERYIEVSGLLLMFAGIILRGFAIFTLGKYFTGKVQILTEHRLVRDGLYRHIRHPAYTGALVAHLGLGLAFANWISFLLIFCPVLFAALRRIQVEEEVLREAFGREYTEYANKTKRLLPGIY
jgi:protein-S-isoprenylcysteine O-methyltransferase Ste14